MIVTINLFILYGRKLSLLSFLIIKNNSFLFFHFFSLIHNNGNAHLVVLQNTQYEVRITTSIRGVMKRIRTVAITGCRFSVMSV